MSADINGVTVPANTSGTYTTPTLNSSVNYLMHVFSIAGSSWQSGSSVLPKALYGDSFVTGSGQSATYVYALGGLSGLLNGGTYSSTVYLNSPNADGSMGGWTAIRSLPTALAYFPALAYNGNMYIMGGLNSNLFLRTVYYSQLGDGGPLGAWAATSQLPVAMDASAAVAYSADGITGYIYLIGGYSNGYLSTVYRAAVNSNGSLGAWSAAGPNMPQGKAYHTTILYKGRIYAVGGMASNSGGVNTVYSAAINSDGTTGSWRTENPTPIAVYKHSSVVVNGYLYVIGGMNPSGSAAVSAVYAAPFNSDGTLGTWQQTVSLPVATHSAGATTYNNTIALAGGYTTTAVNTVYNESSTVISGSCGPASVTVNAPPTCMMTPASQNINLGSQATLNYAIAGNATSVSISDGTNSTPLPASSTGSYTPSPIGNTNYTMTVANSAGSAQCGPVAVTVTAPPTCTLAPATQTITLGNQATINYTMDANTTTASINGVSIPLYFTSGVYNPYPTNTTSPTNYIMTVGDSAGTNTCGPASVAVNLTPPPPTATLSLESGIIMVGQSASLDYTISGAATSATINGIAVSLTSPNTYVTPPLSASGTFTLVVSNTGGSNSYSVGATVTSVAGTTLLPVTQRVPKNSTASLIWTASNVSASTCAISNGTNTYQLSNATPNDSGTFTTQPIKGLTNFTLTCTGVKDSIPLYPSAKATVQLIPSWQEI